MNQPQPQPKPNPNRPQPPTGPNPYRVGAEATVRTVSPEATRPLTPEESGRLAEERRVLREELTDIYRTKYELTDPATVEARVQEGVAKGLFYRPAGESGPSDPNFNGGRVEGIDDDAKQLLTELRQAKADYLGDPAHQQELLDRFAAAKDRQVPEGQVLEVYNARIQAAIDAGVLIRASGQDATADTLFDGPRVMPATPETAPLLDIMRDQMRTELTRQYAERVEAAMAGVAPDHQAAALATFLEGAIRRGELDVQAQRPPKGAKGPVRYEIVAGGRYATSQPEIAATFARVIETERKHLLTHPGEESRFQENLRTLHNAAPKLRQGAEQWEKDEAERRARTAEARAQLEQLAKADEQERLFTASAAEGGYAENIEATKNREGQQKAERQAYFTTWFDSADTQNNFSKNGRWSGGEWDALDFVQRAAAEDLLRQAHDAWQRGDQAAFDRLRDQAFELADTAEDRQPKHNYAERPDQRDLLTASERRVLDQGASEMMALAEQQEARARELENDKSRSPEDRAARAARWRAMAARTRELAGPAGWEMLAETREAGGIPEARSLDEMLDAIPKLDRRHSGSAGFDLHDMDPAEAKKAFNEIRNAVGARSRMATHRTYGSRRGGNLASQRVFRSNDHPNVLYVETVRADGRILRVDVVSDRQLLEDNTGGRTGWDGQVRPSEQLRALLERNWNMRDRDRRQGVAGRMRNLALGRTLDRVSPADFDPLIGSAATTTGTSGPTPGPSRLSGFLGAARRRGAQLRTGVAVGARSGRAAAERAMESAREFFGDPGEEAARNLSLKQLSDLADRWDYLADQLQRKSLWTNRDRVDYQTYRQRAENARSRRSRRQTARQAVNAYRARDRSVNP